MLLWQAARDLDATELGGPDMRTWTLHHRIQLSPAVALATVLSEPTGR